MPILSHKIRIDVRSEAQRIRLSDALNFSRELYNAALEERISAYAKNGKVISLHEQFKSITILNQEDGILPDMTVAFMRWPLMKLNFAFKGFFKRALNGGAGFPRFQTQSRFKSFGYSDKRGWKIEGKYLILGNIGNFRLLQHRPIEGEIRSLSMKKEGNRWFAIICVKVSVHVHSNDNAVGIDVGIRDVVTLSTGESVISRNIQKRKSSSVRRIQRKIARSKIGSNNRRKACSKLSVIKRKERNARRTFHHQISARLARDYSLIVVEDINIQNLTRSAKGTVDVPGIYVAQKRGLNRSIRDAGWGVLFQMLSYKAECAGGELIKVDPAHTSNDCSGCGDRTPKARKRKLYHCSACGLMIDADKNGALNILQRGLGVVAQRNAKLAA